MRWLFGFFMVVVVAWCGWWFAGQHLITREANALIAAERAKGAKVDFSDLSVAGFANRFDLTIRDVDYLDASQNFGWKGAALQLYAMSWKPWHIIASLPQRQILTLDGQAFALDATTLHASLRAKPSYDLPLAELRLIGKDLVLRRDAATLFAAKDMAIALRDARQPAPAPAPASTSTSTSAESGPSPDAATPAATGQTPQLGVPYQLGVQLQGLPAPEALLRDMAALALPDTPVAPLPAQIDAAHLGLVVSLSRELNRHAAEPPQVLALELQDLSLNWGALGFKATGRISPDAKGFAAGRLDLTVTQWQYLPALLVASGKLPENRVGLITSVMRAMAQAGGNPDQVTLPLVLQDGWMNIGPVPLGPAPRLQP